MDDLTIRPCPTSRTSSSYCSWLCACAPPNGQKPAFGKILPWTCQTPPTTTHRRSSLLPCSYDSRHTWHNCLSPIMAGYVPPAPQTKGKRLPFAISSHGLARPRLRLLIVERVPSPDLTTVAMPCKAVGAQTSNVPFDTFENSSRPFGKHCKT